jgi:CubicO group peptidase (beta-lactamase class C family)
VRPRPFVCLCFLAAVLPTGAQDEAVRLQRAFERLDAFVEQHMKENATPGLALAVTGREGLLRVATYGFADLKARRPVTPATLFEIGSISKSFTAIALLQLREEGKFDPQAPVTRYLPWFEIPTQFEPITGHHLLTHSAGIPRDRDDVYFSRYALYALREQRTGYAPGNKFAYSNIGFQVLGVLLGKIEGKPYAEILQRRIFDPVGMTASAPIITFETHQRLAVGYVPLYDDRPPHPSQPLVEAPRFEYYAGDGSVAATPADLAAYLRTLLNRGAAPNARVLSEESFALLIQPAVKRDEKSSYGYGLWTRQEAGHRILGHSGGMVGYAAQLLGDLDAGLGVVVFVNGPGDPEQVAEFALNSVRAALDNRELPPLPPAALSTRVENAGDYGGTYTSPQGKVFSVRAGADPSRPEQGLRLYFQNGAGGPSIALERRGEDAFYVAIPGFERFLLRFARDAAGQVVEASYGSDWYAGESYRGPRTISSPEAWLAYPGHYRLMNPWTSNIRVLLRKGKLWLVAGQSEQELVELAPGLFQVGPEPTAERLRFDAVVEGEALRANLSGLNFYRTLIP